MRPVADILQSAELHLDLLSSLVNEPYGELTYHCGMHYWRIGKDTTPIPTNRLEKLFDEEVILFSDGCFIRLFLPVWVLLKGYNPMFLFNTSCSDLLSEIENPSDLNLTRVFVATGYTVDSPQEWKTYIADTRWQIP